MHWNSNFDITLCQHKNWKPYREGRSLSLHFIIWTFLKYSHNNLFQIFLKILWNVLSRPRDLRRQQTYLTKINSLFFAQQTDTDDETIWFGNNRSIWLVNFGPRYLGTGRLRQVCLTTPGDQRSLPMLSVYRLIKLMFEYWYLFN